MLLIRPALLAAIVVWLSIGAPASAQIRPRYQMDIDPELTLARPVLVFPDSYNRLWLEALARPEADLQRVAAETIAQGHKAGIPGLSSAIPRLEELVRGEQTHPLARFAAARALLVLDARSSAELLFAASQSSTGELRQLIEPVLARWRFEPARALWRERLESDQVALRDRSLAIRGLGASGDQSALPALLALVEDRQRAAPLRVAAAQAAGNLQAEGLEGLANKLAPHEQAPIFCRVAAVALLERHDSDEARSLLLKLARDPEPSVAAAAMARLFAIDPDLTVPIAEEAMRNDDANVRLQGVHSWVARPTPERVAVVAGLLDDPHPAVRGHVCQALFDLTKSPDLDVPIRQAAMRVLSAESWRGQEQAALLLGELDHEPAASRLVQLLESPRGEVMVASAWGLRMLSVPATLPALLDKATRQTDLRKKEPVPLWLDRQVAHLCEAMGLMNFAPAEPLLVRYIPKDYAMGELSRSAAIWALGLLHAGQPDEALAGQLAGRLTDPPSAVPPEMPKVRTLSAVSLGRMRAASQVDAMKNYRELILANNYPTWAINWAVKEITGEELAPPATPTDSKGGWFLESLDDVFGAAPAASDKSP